MELLIQLDFEWENLCLYGTIRLQCRYNSLGTDNSSGDRAEHLLLAFRGVCVQCSERSVEYIVCPSRLEEHLMRVRTDIVFETNYNLLSLASALDLISWTPTEYRQCFLDRDQTQSVTVRLKQAAHLPVDSTASCSQFVLSTSSLFLPSLFHLVSFQMQLDISHNSP